MMFPAIFPMVLIYDRLIKNAVITESPSTGKGESKESLTVGTDDSQEQQKMKSLATFGHHIHSRWCYLLGHIFWYGL